MATETELTWKPRIRNYELERRQLSLEWEDSSSEHPLQSLITSLDPTPAKPAKGSNENAKSPVVDDPLSGGAGVTSSVDPLSDIAFDPLSASLFPTVSPANTASKTDKEGAKQEAATPDVAFEPWSVKRTNILATYTTSEKISITTSFLPKEDLQKLETKAQAAAADKMKHRLEQLDDLDEGAVKETLNLSQKEYVKKIDDMHQTLASAWEVDQRVKALKIAIQCAKLLADISVIQFYPSKFVLITDILDKFGKCVFERIKEKSSYVPSGSTKSIPLPDDFTSEQVPDSGKETCRNWFFKIASIRELLPRYYVEAALLKCYRFLTDSEYTQALVRLTALCRGIGDPLVSSYARAYLCRVGIDVAPESRKHLIPTFTDYLKTLTQLSSDPVQNILAVQSLDSSKYLHLFAPAVEWILQCVANQAPNHTLEDVMVQVKEGGSKNPIVLHAIMTSFKPQFVAQRALQFAEMIKDCEEIGMPRYKLYVALGNCVVQTDPPAQDRLPLLKTVWKSVMKVIVPAEYIACSQVWIEYVAKHFNKREVNALLDDLIKHMTPDRAFESHYAQLVSIISRILSHMKDFSVVFAMDKFLPFVDMFQKESVKVEVCKIITNAFLLHKDDIRDPVVVNAMMYLCKAMSDSLNSLSLDDDRRQISQLICGFLQKVSFGQDFEQQLNFFMEARAIFCNLDAVLVHLVHCVNLLSMSTHSIVKGEHTRKTSGFVRACAAYCFITIPSVSNILLQLQLYLISGRVAIANGAMSQGDAFFKAAITILKDVPQTMEIERKNQSTEPFVASYLNNFLSTLLVVPDNPDLEALYLLRGLLNAVQEYRWAPNSDYKITVYMNAICLLSAACQDRYIYRVEKVDSNDCLYAGDKKLVAELAKLVIHLIGQIMEYLKSLSGMEELRKRQSSIALGLFSRLLAHADITSEPSIRQLLINLWNLSVRSGGQDAKLVSARFYASLQRSNEEHLKNLAAQLTVVQ